MILFNTTFSVDDKIADAFVEFIRDTYIPLALSSGLYNPLLTRVRPYDEADQEGTTSFALQVRVPSQQLLDEFRTDILPQIYRAIGHTWGHGVALFESVLDVIPGE